MDHLIEASASWVGSRPRRCSSTSPPCSAFGSAERRTLADLSPFDFVAVAAVGSVVGRLPSATDSSYSPARRPWSRCSSRMAASRGSVAFPASRHLLERAPRLLVAHGRVLEGELRRCGHDAERPARACSGSAASRELGEARFVDPRSGAGAYR